jgi:hypothetical protein
VSGFSPPTGSRRSGSRHLGAVSAISRGSGSTWRPHSRHQPTSRTPAAAGVAERHRLTAVKLHPLRRRLPATDGASRACNGAAVPDGGCGGLSLAKIAFSLQRR